MSISLPSNASEIVVVGGGPAGLIAAETLATDGRSVTLLEHMPSPGRKLLLAGRGGLNLTHSEAPEQLLGRYATASAALVGALQSFTPTQLRRWSAGLGQPTIVGTSGRVFPKAFRATPLLRAWLLRLGELGVDIRTRHRWCGWNDNGSLDVLGPDGRIALRPLATVLALGGATWPRTGSDAAWVPLMKGAGFDITPLRPANGGFVVQWSPTFAQRCAGTPLKNVRLRFRDAESRGGATITATGIEGGAVYAIGAALRDAIDRDGYADLMLDLHPDISPAKTVDRLANSRPGDSTSSRLRRMGLSAVAVALMRETGTPTDQLNAVTIRLTGVQPIDRAISTAGGIALHEVDERFMLIKHPGVFVCGEMLDWEAPTGGYLLQACFSTGVAAANGALSWLRSEAVPCPR